MKSYRFIVLFIVAFFFCNDVSAQLFINEGSNKNYSAFADEYGEYPDWIEIYNSGTDTIHLLNYALSDDVNNPTKWTFPNIDILPGEYKVVFCSGRDKKPLASFTYVASANNYTPIVGWNTHNFISPLAWDGISSLLINVCSYSSLGYTSNSVFNQSNTAYNSSLFSFQDGSPNICDAIYGTRVKTRPNIQLNGIAIGTGTVNNSPYDYPAPYGNWYWAAKNQMLIPAAELIAAGLTAGPINSLALDVVSTDTNTVYDYVNFSMKPVAYNEILGEFEPADTILRMHTNFKLSSTGDSVFLFSPSQQLLSSLYVNVDHPDISIGSFPDTSNNIVLFLNGTPESTNNLSQQYSSYLNPPTISAPSGIYNSVISVSITNPNSASTEIRYTLNGDDPDSSSALYTGTPIQIFYSNVLKARAFSSTELPSTTTTATYLFGITHSTPILSVVTDSKNLYGNNGIFSNWQFDWQKAAYAEYFDTSNNLVFSQRAGMQIDGGAGGSRSHPQHSFRLEFDNSTLGDGTINYPLIPNRPARDKYSRIYLRNGSNYYLSLPYKDAAHVQGMGKETNNYFSAWRPITVYINGQYFGLYELREKWDAEYFEELENANADSMDLLSLSFWNGSTLRAIEGSVDSFLVAYNIFKVLNTANPNFLTFANKYVDMDYYTDYIIGETWAGNVDWPNNNIKIYRSNTTGFRWRFCLIDLEGAMNPNGFSDASHDHISDLINADPNNPYINIFLHSVKNSIYKNYFINRYADVMNTAYQYSKLSANANAMFNQTVIEMPKEYARWGDPNNINGQMSDFVNNHQTLLSELSIRTANVRDFIQNDFSLASQVNVTLDVLPAGAGKIKISTIIPDSLPWTGVYFNGNPVKFTAIANPGYEFDHWDTNAVLSAIDTNIAITKNVSASTTFRAVFSYTGDAGRIAISEVNYNSDSTHNSGNWIEFHNYGNAPVDLSGWRFTDSSASNNFYFPQGTILQDGQYLVLVDDTTKFHSQFPLINVFGPTGFGFNNTTEALTLIDNNNLPVISMRYIDSLPWPKLADGYGMTLELKNDSLDPALASSWFAGCIGGSPGGPYVPCSEEIIFSEVNYNSSLATDAGDWVELYNKTNSPIDVSGWVFSDGDNLHLYELPINSIVPALGRIVLTQDTALFKSRFPMFNGSYGPFGFGLSSNGEAIRLFDQSGSLYQTMMYESAAPWPNGANGNGYTLELVDYNGNLSEGSNWTDGCPEGSPGTALITPCGTVSVNNPDAPKENVIVYPNPSTGIFNVQVKDVKNSTTKAYAEVYNYLGEKIVSDIQINKHDIIQIDLNGYARGMYVLRVVMGDEAVQKVMVVE